MTAIDAAYLFSEQVKTTPVLEWVAIVASVAEVLLARANKVLLYPAGLLSTAIYTWLFMRPQTRLYADAILNIYYFVMSIYGWVIWHRTKNGVPLPIGRASGREWIMIGVYSLLGWGLLYALLVVVFPYIFAAYKVSDVAGLDALISATAWVGMWLLARRMIENWILLNVSNIIAIPVLIYKGMPFTAALTLFLFIVAIFGYIEWKKQCKQQSFY